MGIIRDYLAQLEAAQSFQVCRWHATASWKIAGGDNGNLKPGDEKSWTGFVSYSRPRPER